MITGFSQIKTEGLAWQEANYGPHLEAIARGEAPAPDRYRILANRAVVLAYEKAVDWGLPRPLGLTFVSLRLIQNFMLFGLAYTYYRRLGIAPYPALVGLSALAWGMTQSNYGSDLAFDAWTDVLFYLGAAIALLEGRPRWLIPISALAALNRESSVLIPIMGLACAVSIGTRQARLTGFSALIALAGWLLVFAAVHLILGPSPRALQATGATPGFIFLRYNLIHAEAWGHAAGALGILPILAGLSWRGWPPLLRPLFWSVVPVWCVAHLFCAPLDQSRVLLLPQILVFIPGMLGGLVWWRWRREQGLEGLLA